MDKKTCDVMFSSGDLNAITPDDFFAQLDREFEFQLDLAADESNTKCAYFYDEETNALKQDWTGRCFCNPPYGRKIGRWIDKAADEAEKKLIGDKGEHPLVVMLLPARTDTRWFQTITDTADEIRFVKGRLRFVGNRASAPFPSMVAIWYGSYHKIGSYPEGPYEWNLIWRRK